MATTLGGASPALAQSVARPDRPYRGLFGSGVADAEQSLVGTASVGGGYDTDVLAATFGGQQPRGGTAGWLAQGTVGLNYTLARDRYQLGSTAATSGQYSPEMADPLRTYTGSLGGSVRLLDKPAVTANQSVQYQPLTFLGALGDPTQPFVGQSAPVDSSMVIDSEHYLTYQGGLAVSQPLSRRVTASSNYQYRQANRQDNEFFTQSVGAQVRVGLTKGASFYGGYAVNESRYADGRTYRNQTPRFGVDMAKALSLTRQTTVAFGAGSTAVNSGGDTQVRATGNAELVHQMGQTWQLSSAYARGLRYVDTFAEPLFSDSVNVALGGMVNRRVQLTASATAARGEGLSSQGTYNSLAGAAVMSVALSRYSNLNLSYTRYRYDFDEEIELPEGALNQFERQGIRASVSFWMPLLTQRRRSNASR